MSNQVEIDPAALVREADAVVIPDTAAGAAPGAQPGGPGGPGAGAADPNAAPAGEMSDEEAARRAAELAPQLKPLIVRGAKMLMPAWKLTDDECGALAATYALPIVYWVPDLQLSPKWGSLIMAAILTLMIIDSRRDTEGRLMPFRMKSAGSSSTAEGARVNDGAPNNTKAAGGFSTAEG